MDVARHVPHTLIPLVEDKTSQHNMQTAIKWREPRRILLITTPGISQHASSPLNGRNHVVTVNSGQHAKEITKLSVICTTTDTNTCFLEPRRKPMSTKVSGLSFSLLHTMSQGHIHTHTQRQKTQWSLQENTPIRSRRMRNPDTHDD